MEDTWTILAKTTDLNSSQLDRIRAEVLSTLFNDDSKLKHGDSHKRVGKC